MRSGSHCTVHIAAVPVTDLGLQKEQCEVTLTGTLPDQGLSSGIGSFSERRRVAFSGFAYQGRPALPSDPPPGRNARWLPPRWLRILSFDEPPSRCFIGRQCDLFSYDPD